ncbi:MAG: hypothetical protein U1D55_14475 [Phycisphaerae bacterium]
MTAANNEREALPVGLIADADETRPLAATIASCSEMRLVAQSGMPQSTAAPGAPWVDDTRVLLAQAGVRGLIVALPTRAAVEITNNAVSRGIHVWHAPPIARDFAEAVDACRRARDGQVVLRVASWVDHIRETLRWALRQSTGFRPLFTEVSLAAEGPQVQSWRSSESDAGGGVLMSSGYAALESLVAVRGLPESVFGLLGRCRKRAAELARETEDVAVAVLRYEGGGIGMIRASWDVPPYEIVVSHHGAESSVKLGESEIEIVAAAGEPIDSRELPCDWLTADLRLFAQAVHGGLESEATTAALERHLAVSSLIESIALSSRTGTPESPRRLYEVQKWPEPTR